MEFNRPLREIIEEDEHYQKMVLAENRCLKKLMAPLKQHRSWQETLQQILYGNWRSQAKS